MQASTRSLPSKILRRTIKSNTFKPVTLATTTTTHPLSCTTARKMSMFAPRFYTQAEPNFSGLFRLIDEFDNYATQQQSGGGQHSPQQQGRRRPAGRRQQQQQHVPTFAPRFDLKETEADFELHGELPGVERDQVQVEFADPQTLVVRGRVERSYTSGTPPPAAAGLVEDDGGSDKMSGALTQGDEQQQQQQQQQQPTTAAEKEKEKDKERRSSFHATVEDDAEEGASTSAASSTAAPTPATTAAELSRPAPAADAAAAAAEQPRYKYWISERSVGEFSRSFQFPVRVDHDGVRASLNNGILTVTVPKAKRHESRRIAIN